MHTVDASSEPSVSFKELNASNGTVCRDSMLKSDAQAHFGNTAMPSGQTRPAIESKTIGLETAPVQSAASGGIPSWKRLLDITFILLTLPLWLPVVLVVALWIRIVSPGPIFFRQERVGYRGSRFMILKFRTMKCNVETTIHERHLEQLIQTDRPMTKLDAAGDPRIVRGGGLLRATGLDELPQLWNVLRGQMSLVGPRPCTVKEFLRYQPWQQERANAAPGLTGYWQVSGKNRTTFTEMINLDIFYTKNVSLRLDLEIILKTVPAILEQFLETRGAAGTSRPAARSISERCSSRQCSR
jgi:lipopolysaccharide/colanic/teichoic acid biosynthesis glycosyltransferase